MAELDHIERETLNDAHGIVLAVAGLLGEVDPQRGLRPGACECASMLLARAKSLIGNVSSATDIDSTVIVNVEAACELLDLASGQELYADDDGRPPVSLSYSSTFMLGESLLAAGDKLDEFLRAHPAPAGTVPAGLPTE